MDAITNVPIEENQFRIDRLGNAITSYLDQITDIIQQLNGNKGCI